MSSAPPFEEWFFLRLWCVLTSGFFLLAGQPGFANNDHQFTRKLKTPSMYLIPMKTRFLICTLSLVAQPLVAQDAVTHPRGLFEAPLPGIETPMARTTKDATNWKDKFHFSVTAGIRSESNIFHSATNEESDVIFSITPTLSYQSAPAGGALNTFSFVYAPSYQIFSKNSDRNTLNHTATFSYGKKMPKSDLGISLSYHKTDGSNRFTGGFVDRESLRLGVNFSHILTGKTRLDLGANYIMDNFDTNGLFDTGSYSVNAALKYQATGKLAIGPRISYGGSTVSGNADHGQWSAGIAFDYQYSGKTTFTGDIGFSQRSFSGGGAASNLDYISWALGMSHQLGAKTAIQASIYRRAKASYNFVNSGYIATGAAITATYDYSSRLAFYSTISFENDDYFESGAGGTNLDNDYFSITLGSRYRVNESLRVGGSLTWTDNDSNNAFNNFENFSAGITATYNFW